MNSGASDLGGMLVVYDLCCRQTLQSDGALVLTPLTIAPLTARETKREGMTRREMADWESRV